MEYKNIKTGVTIDVLSKISGKNWLPVDTGINGGEQNPNNEVNNKDDDDEENAKENAEESHNAKGDLGSVTKEQIMQELDANGVKYDSNAKKQVLYDLMMEQSHE